MPCMRSATSRRSAKTTSSGSRKNKQLSKYAGTSLIGKLGIESSYEKALHGSDGSRQILVNAAGRSVQRQGTLTPELQEINPVPGRDLITSIDLPTATRRRTGAHQPPRLGGRHRSEQRRRHRARIDAGLRSESVHARPHARGIRRAARQHRRAAAQSRVARAVSVGLYHQAGARARGARLPRGRA